MAYDNDTGRSLDALNPKIPIADPVGYRSFGLSRFMGEGGKSIQNVTPFVPRIVGIGGDIYGLQLANPNLASLSALANIGDTTPTAVVNPILTFFNDFQTYTATCPPGFQGPSVTKTANAGSVSSTVSIDTANSLALSLITAEAKSALSCNPIPVANITYVSATGNVAFTGYISPTYMYTGTEPGYRGSSSSIPPWDPAKKYNIFHRVFYNGKFYQSNSANNINNNPLSVFWHECIVPLHWLQQNIVGSFTRFLMLFLGGLNFCFLSLPPALVFENTPPGPMNPGVDCFRRDWIYAGGGTVNHSTGIETWGGSYQVYDVVPFCGPNTICGIGSLTTVISDQTDVLGNLLNHTDFIFPGAGIILSDATENQSIYDSNVPICTLYVGGGGNPPFNAGVYPPAFLNRTYTIYEDPFTILSHNGVLPFSSAGTWPDAWTANGLTATQATFAISNAIPSHSYTLLVNFAASGGATPASQSYAISTDGSGHATVIVSIPLGSASQQCSIGSYEIF